MNAPLAGIDDPGRHGPHAVPHRVPHATLRDAANDAGVLVGAAVAPECFADAAYRAAVAEHFSMLQPENALKWAALRPSREAFDFASGDAVVRAARANGQPVRGHVLAWHAYNPGWLRRGRYAPRELGALLHEHVETVAGRYAGDVFAWDVVNEVFDEGRPDGMRASVWYDRPGIGHAGRGARYVEHVFRWARAAAPDARLFYNDDPAAAGCRAGAVRRMLAELLDRGAPVDGVGLQLHLDLATDVARLEEEIEALADLGLELHVTELDVALPTGADGRPLDPDALERQAALYARVVAACLRLPRCTAVQTWGVDDGHSWISSFSRGAFGAALLLDAAYRPKPAYHAVAAAFADAARDARRAS